MGLYEIIFGGSTKPKVNPKEFKKVRFNLEIKGFSRQERDRVEEIFSGDMYEQVNSNTPKGIDKQEITDRIAWMRANKSKHHFSDAQISIIESELTKFL